MKKTNAEIREEKMKYLGDLLDTLPEDRQHSVIHYLIGYMSMDKNFKIAFESAIKSIGERI